MRAQPVACTLQATAGRARLSGMSASGRAAATEASYRACNVARMSQLMNRLTDSSLLSDSGGT